MKSDREEAPAHSSPGVLVAGSGPAEAAAFFWFSSQTISESGDRLYGSYAYSKLLPLLTPSTQGTEGAWFVLFDGDALIPAEGFYNYLRPEDRKLLDVQVALFNSTEASDIWYVIAVLGTPAGGWSAVDAALRKAMVLGYKGMTAAREPNRDAFLNACRILSLPLAARIDGVLFKKISFGGMLHDSALVAMGYHPVTAEC